MLKKQNKTWVSPLLAVFFGFLAISGLLMLFHLKIPGVHRLHELFGILFVIAAIFHLTLNWNVLTAYFRNNKAALSIGVAIVLAILALFISSGAPRHDGNQYGHHYRSIGK